MKNASLRLRRSALFVPGSNARALEKSRTLSVDVVIYDLEDAVAPEMKAVAREQVASACAAAIAGTADIIVRVNSLHTGWGTDDVRCFAGVPLAGILLPKVSTRSDLKQFIACWDQYGGASNTPVWAMLETPAAIVNATEISRAHARLETLVVGTNDLAKELRATVTTTRHSLWMALQTVVLAARAANKFVLDGVYNQLDNDQGFENECREAKSFGFDGKTLIHPNQIAGCHRIFSPSAEELLQAERLVAAYDEGVASGRSVVVFEGQMVEHLHVESAKRLLTYAERIKTVNATE